MPRKETEPHSDLYGIWLNSLISALDILIEDFIHSMRDDTKIDTKLRNFASLVRSVEKVQMMVETAYEKPDPDKGKGNQNRTETIQSAEKLRQEIARRLTRLADTNGKAELSRKPDSG